jgi:hypothetical protein
MDFEIPVEPKAYHKALLMIINIPLNLNLSPMEIDILSCMLNHNMETIDHLSRKIIADELKRSNFNINNYIISLRDKNMLITKAKDKNLYVNPKIIDLVKDSNIGFKLKINN